MAKHLMPTHMLAFLAATGAETGDQRGQRDKETKDQGLLLELDAIVAVALVVGVEFAANLA